MIKKISGLSAYLLILAGAQPVSATVLTFADLKVVQEDGSIAPISIGGAVPDAYGGNVTATTDATGSYLEGKGFTPNVTVTYTAYSTITDEYVDDHIEYWGKSGSLNDIIYTRSNSDYGEITLTPENGFAIVFDSFDMRTSSFSSSPNSSTSIETLQILDVNKAVLWDSGVSVIRETDSNGDYAHDTFTPNISSTGAITLRWGKNRKFNIGNISFHQQRLGGGLSNNECLAQYKEDGSLYIPCVAVPNGTVYKATMQIKPALNPLTFELTDAEKR